MLHIVRACLWESTAEFGDMPDYTTVVCSYAIPNSNFWKWDSRSYFSEVTSQNLFLPAFFHHSTYIFLVRKTVFPLFPYLLNTGQFPKIQYSRDNKKCQEKWCYKFVSLQSLHSWRITIPAYTLIKINMDIIVEHLHNHRSLWWSF